MVVNIYINTMRQALTQTLESGVKSPRLIEAGDCDEFKFPSAVPVDEELRNPLVFQSIAGGSTDNITSIEELVGDMAANKAANASYNDYCFPWS